MRQFNFIYKYIDQLFFSLLNVGTIVFVSKYLESDLAAKYILINTYASFSLIVIVALIITPFWVFSGERHGENFIFGVTATIFLSIITAVCVVFIYILRQNANFNDILQIFSIAISYPLYDFLRRTLYVKGKEKVSAITTLTLTIYTSIGYILLYINEYNYYYAYVYLLALGLTVSSIWIYIYSVFKFDIDFKLRLKSLPSNFKRYFNFGRWSAASMICFWTATQGVFIYFYGKVSNQEIVSSRLLLSLTGIMSIYFASIENKIMPNLRHYYLKSDIQSIIKEWKAYKINGLIVTGIATTVIFIGYVSYYGYSFYALNLFLIFSCYQMITGIFKFYAYVLKSAQYHNVTFVSNFGGLVSTIVVGEIIVDVSNYTIGLMILANGIICSLGYLYFIKKYGVMHEKNKL